jgi:hypothetical protein
MNPDSLDHKPAPRRADPATPPAGYVPLDRETRACVDTKTAAYHLGRRPQTLRRYACYGLGDIQPVTVVGRLAWPVAEIKRVLGVAT